MVLVKRMANNSSRVYFGTNDREGNIVVIIDCCSRLVVSSLDARRVHEERTAVLDSEETERLNDNQLGVIASRVGANLITFEEGRYVFYRAKL